MCHTEYNKLPVCMIVLFCFDCWTRKHFHVHLIFINREVVYILHISPVEIVYNCIASEKKCNICHISCEGL